MKRSFTSFIAMFALGVGVVTGPTLASADCPGRFVQFWESLKPRAFYLAKCRWAESEWRELHSQLSGEEHEAAILERLSTDPSLENYVALADSLLPPEEEKHATAIEKLEHELNAPVLSQVRLLNIWPWNAFGGRVRWSKVPLLSRPYQTRIKVPRGTPGSMRQVIYRLLQISAIIRNSATSEVLVRPPIKNGSWDSGRSYQRVLVEKLRPGVSRTYALIDALRREFPNVGLPLSKWDRTKLNTGLSVAGAVTHFVVPAPVQPFIPWDFDVLGQFYPTEQGLEVWKESQASGDDSIFLNYLAKMYNLRAHLHWGAMNTLRAFAGAAVVASAFTGYSHVSTLRERFSEAVPPAVLKVCGDFMETAKNPEEFRQMEKAFHERPGGSPRIVRFYEKLNAPLHERLKTEKDPEIRKQLQEKIELHLRLADKYKN